MELKNIGRGLQGKGRGGSTEASGIAKKKKKKKTATLG
jgi:hypothetical protein